jgi:deazaflavin-dependent oxidoreductase (nitroreductase family)
MARLFKPDVVTLLSVPGRRSGVWHSAAVAVLDHDGERCLMSAYGDTEWSRNLRAAGHGRLTRRGGRVEPIRVVEVPIGQRPTLIEAYLAAYSTLPTVAKTFAALPDPDDHPTFRIAATADGDETKDE